MFWSAGELIDIYENDLERKMVHKVNEKGWNGHNLLANDISNVDNDRYSE